MNEYIVTYRDNNSGQLINVHTCNLDNEHQAIKFANNSLLDHENFEYFSINNLPEDSPIPF